MPFGESEPETVEMLSSALLAALANLEKDHSLHSEAAKARLARAMARNLIDGVNQVERDLKRLKAYASGRVASIAGLTPLARSVERPGLRRHPEPG